MSTDRGVRLALIPAGGGSKRILRKNIQPFRGTPLPARAIRMLADDAEIAAVTVSAGAEVPSLRPPEISRDHTGTRPAAHPAQVQRALRIDDAGQFSWGTRAAWLHGAPVMQARTQLHLLSHWRVQDIDTPEDWERAELRHQLIEARSA